MELLNPNLGEQVLKRLSRFVDLPSTGYVAGQAVASALEEILFSRIGVFNDVDVYRALTLDEIVAMRRAATSRRMSAKSAGQTPSGRKMFNPRIVFSAVDSDVANVSSLDYGAFGLDNVRSGYSLVKTERHDMLNKIAIVWNRYEDMCGSPDIGKKLLASFDINAVQVGVDLNTGLLHWTPHYERFLKTRELELVTAFTPMQSLLRLFKKSRELDNVYFNEQRWIDFVRRVFWSNQGPDEIVEIRQRLFHQNVAGKLLDLGEAPVPAWRQHYVAPGEGFHRAPMVFAERYHAIFQAHRDKLGEYFELSAHPEKSLWLCTAKGSTRRVTETPNMADEYRLAAVSPRVHAQRYFPPRPQVARRRALFEAFLSSIPQELQIGYRAAYNILGDDYLSNVDSAQEYRWLANRLVKHPEIHRVAAFPLRMQLDHMKLLVKRCRAEYLPEPWGVISSLGHVGRFHLLADSDFLEGTLGELRASTTPLVQPLPLPSEVDGVAVVELQSAYDLRTEGNRMGHCVGGYTLQLSRGHSRIISLRPSDDVNTWATLEWEIREVENGKRGRRTSLYQMHLRQIYARFNEPASEALRLVEEKLRSAINDWLQHHPVEAKMLLRPRAKPVDKAERNIIVF